MAGDLDPVKAGLYQYLRGLPEEEFNELTTLARQPDSSDALKKVAARFIPDADQLQSFVEFVNPATFTGDDGSFDEAKAVGHLTTLFGQPTQPQFGSGMPQHRDWGQHSGQVPGGPPGSEGRAQAQPRRDYVSGGRETPPGPAATAGRADAQRRLDHRNGGRR